jgi:hypothetical protein
MEAGDLEQADRLLARLSGVAEKLAQPFMRWYAAIVRAQRSSIIGPVEETERLALAGLELGRSAEQPDSLLWFMGHLYVARFLHGSLDRGDPHRATAYLRPV